MVCAEVHFSIRTQHSILGLCGHIPVMGLSNNCSGLRVMSTLSYLDYFFHLSMQMTKCEGVQAMHVIQSTNCYEVVVQR